MGPDQGSALLSQQDLLDFLGAGVRWEDEPNLDKVTIERDGEPKELVKRDVVAKLQADERLKLKDHPLEYFDKAESWKEVRSVINNVLNEELKNAQPDEMRIQALEDEYARVLEKRGIPKDRAREMAKQYARAEGEMANREPKSVAATPRTATTSQPATAPTSPQPAEGLRPDTQEMIARAQERATTGGVRWTEYLRHPIWAANQVFAYTKTYVVTFFRRGPSEAGKAAAAAAQAVAKAGIARAKKTAQKTAVEATKKVAGKVVKEGAKTIATEVAMDTTELALAAAPTGVTQVLAAAMEIAKRVWQAAKIAWGLLPKEVRETLKKLAAGAGLAAFFLIQYLLTHWFATALATTALVFGGPFGAVLAPAAFALGLGLESVASSLLSAMATAGTVVVPITTGVTFGTLIAGTSIATFSLAAVLAPLLLAGLVVVAAIASQNQDQEAKATFRLEQTVDPATIDSYGGEAREIKYRLVISTTSDQSVTLKSIGYVIATAGTDTPPRQIVNSLPVGTAASDTPYRVEYSITISNPNYQNSVIINTVTAVGRGEGENDDETEVITTKLTVGTPKFNQPFGYPAAGTIKSLDIEPVKCVNKENRNDKIDPIRDASGKPIGCPTGYKEQDHCGTLLDLYGFGRQCLKGGLDISGPQTTVYSTIEGTVIKSVFDRGAIVNSSGCIPALSPTGFCYPALGGAVYIESLDKKYTVAFLHLAEEGLIPQGSTVTRGQPIGKTYDGRICETRSDGDYCTSTGRHVHYQVFFNQRNNILFADPANVGSCKSGSFLPGEDADGSSLAPRLYEVIGDPLASQTCE